MSRLGSLPPSGLCADVAGCMPAECRAHAETRSRWHSANPTVAESSSSTSRPPVSTPIMATSINDSFGKASGAWRHGISITHDMSRKKKTAQYPGRTAVAMLNGTETSSGTGPPSQSTIRAIPYVAQFSHGRATARIKRRSDILSDGSDMARAAGSLRLP